MRLNCVELVSFNLECIDMSQLDTGGPAFPQPHPPQAFEKAMVFVDGTNLFNRLNDGGLKIADFYKFAGAASMGRQLLRVYIYTTAKKLEKAKSVHGESAFRGCRVVLGDSVETQSGVIREKGVDALLVADLIYHAASRNCQYAVVFSNDSDFSFALKRVEDFGCKTAIVAVVHEAAARLSESCDDYVFLSKQFLIESKWANEF